MAVMPEAARDLLGAPHIAVVATLRADGGVQLIPMWIGHDNGAPTLNTARHRLQVRNLIRDPRITLTVVDRSEPERYLQVRGVAEVSDDPDLEHCEALAHDYTGRPFRPLAPGEERVIVRVRPEQVDYRLPEG